MGFSPLASAVGGLVSLRLLWLDRLLPARVAAVVAVASVVLGWGVAQYPWALVDELRLADAAGARAALWGLLLGAAAMAVLVLPALAYLFSLSDRGLLAANGRMRAALAGERRDQLGRARPCVRIPACSETLTCRCSRPIKIGTSRNEGTCRAGAAGRQGEGGVAAGARAGGASPEA